MSGTQGSSRSPSPLASWLFAHRQQIATGTGAALAAYLAYRAYNSQSATQLGKLRNTLQNYGSAVASVSSSTALIAADLHKFLSSDVDELPGSLRQLNKLLQSQEVQDTLSAAAASVGKGLTGAAASYASTVGGNASGPSALDKVLEAVLSDRGRTLVGMAVGLATKNATSSLCEFMERMSTRAAAGLGAEGARESASSGIQTAISILTSEQGERVLSLLITKSIRAAVSSYVEATTGYNVYDDMVASIAKQEHREAVSEIMSRVTAAFCKEVTRALQRSSANAANGRRRSTCVPPSSILSSCSSASSVISLAGHVQQQPANAAAGASQQGGISATSVLEASAALQQQGLPSSCEVQVQQHRLARAQFPDTSQLHDSAGSDSDRASAPRPVVQQQAWLRQVACLARERDVRSLALEVVASATREATRSTWETLFQRDGAKSSALTLPASATYSLYVLMVVCVSMVMYAIAPRTILV